MTNVESQLCQKINYCRQRRILYCQVIQHGRGAQLFSNTFDHEGLFLFLSSPQPMWYVPLELTHCSKFLEPTSASWRLAWIKFVFLRCIECLGKVGNDIWLGIWQHDINRKGGNSVNHLYIWYQILQYQTSRHPEIFFFLHCEGKNSSI